jgi:hypothetical protein
MRRVATQVSVTQVSVTQVVVMQVAAVLEADMRAAIAVAGPTAGTEATLGMGVTTDAPATHTVTATITDAPPMVITSVSLSSAV